MKLLHIIAEMPPESGIAVVVTRLAAEQFGLGHEVAVATTEGGEVLKFESSKVLKLERENIRLREYVYGGQVEHSTLNVEHRTGEGEGGEVLKFEPASLGATPSQGSSKVLKFEPASLGATPRQESSKVGREYPIFNIHLRGYGYGGQAE